MQSPVPDGGAFPYFRKGDPTGRPELRVLQQSGPSGEEGLELPDPCPGQASDCGIWRPLARPAGVRHTPQAHPGPVDPATAGGSGDRRPGVVLPYPAHNDV